MSAGQVLKWTGVAWVVGFAFLSLLALVLNMFGVVGS